MKVVELPADMKRIPSAQDLAMIMAQVSEHLGDYWYADRVNGFWYIYRTVNGKCETMAGSPEHNQRAHRQFKNALSEATQLTIIQKVN